MLNSLYVVRGVVRNMRRWQGRVNEMSEGERTSAMGAAIGAAAANNAASAIGGMQTVGYQGRDVTYFQCQVGNLPVTGYFDRADFEVGDEVEAVVSHTAQGGVHQCVAIARPVDKVLWTCGSGRGYKVERRIRIKTFTCLMLLMYLVALVVMYFAGGSKNWDTYLDMAGIGFVVSVGMGFMFYLVKPKAHLEAEMLQHRVFELLGFADPAWVDLDDCYAFYRESPTVSGEPLRFPLSYSALRYDSVSIVDHAIVDAERS